MRGMKDWLINFLKALETKLPPPKDCHYALMCTKYGNDEDGNWKDEITVHMKVSDGMRNFFLDDEDFAKDATVLADEIVALVKKSPRINQTEAYMKT